MKWETSVMKGLIKVAVEVLLKNIQRFISLTICNRGSKSSFFFQALSIEKPKL